MSEAEVCASCCYWAEETHVCRRRAPLPIVDSREKSSGELRALWLATDGEDWCGEYEPVFIEEEYEGEEAEETEEEFEDGEWAEDGSPAW